MQISIIIPIYNVEKYIARCINSVIVQTFTDYEIILVDDASPDNALPIAEKLLIEHQIEFQTIKHKTNQGLSEARNSGIKVAKGKYIMFIDSDDELSHKQVLAQFYEAIEREKADFVTANYHLLSEGEIKKNTYLKALSKNKSLENTEILNALLYSQISVSAWNKLINKAFLLQHHLFFQKNLLHEDELWAFQMAIVAKKVYALSDYSYHYNQNNPNAITAKKDRKIIGDKMNILQKQLHIIAEKQLVTPKNKAAFIFHFRRCAWEILRNLPYEKNQWISDYRKIRQWYRKRLFQGQKFLLLPPKMAYKIQQKSQYNRLINIINHHNWH